MMAKQRLTGPLRYGWAVGEADGLTPPAAAVLRALGDFLNYSTWECWPSNPTIAAHAHVSESAVRNAMKHLEQLGVLQRPSARQRIAAGAKREKVILRVDVARLEAMKRTTAAGQSDAPAAADGRGRDGGWTPEPLQAGAQTDHPTHPMNRPKEHTIGAAGAAGGGGEEVRQVLRQAGLSGRGLEQVYALGLPLSVVEDELREMKRARPANPPAFLHHRLHVRAGIVTDSKAKRDRQQGGSAVERLQELRRTRVYGDPNEVDW